MTDRHPHAPAKAVFPNGEEITHCEGEIRRRLLEMPQERLAGGVLLFTPDRTIGVLHPKEAIFDVPQRFSMEDVLGVVPGRLFLT